MSLPEGLSDNEKRKKIRDYVDRLSSDDNSSNSRGGKDLDLKISSVVSDWGQISKNKSPYLVNRVGAFGFKSF